MSDANQGTALVTGASSGIGAVYADRLARRGYDLILVARDAVRLEENAARIVAETGRRATVLAADLTDPAALDRVTRRLAEDDGITLLVNNAGATLPQGLMGDAPDALVRLIALNVTAPTLLAQAAVQAFKARKRGAIVNVASVLALAPELADGVYCGSKAYLLDLTLSMAVQLAGSGVQVQALLPGATRTEIFDRIGMSLDDWPQDWIMDAGDLVDAALVGLDRGELVTIPPLADETMWTRYDTARRAMGMELSRREVAPRYRAA